MQITVSIDDLREYEGKCEKWNYLFIQELHQHTRELTAKDTVALTMEGADSVWQRADKWRDAHPFPKLIPPA